MIPDKRRIEERLCKAYLACLSIGAEEEEVGGEQGVADAIGRR